MVAKENIQGSPLPLPFPSFVDDVSLDDVSLDDVSLDDVYGLSVGAIDAKSHILQTQQQQSSQLPPSPPPKSPMSKISQPHDFTPSRLAVFNQPEFQPMVSDNALMQQIADFRGYPGRAQVPTSKRGQRAKPRTYMQWIKHHRRTQQRAARRRLDAANGRFDCKVPGCGKKYSSSGGIRYHLRNCSHEGLPQTPASLAQLADAKAKEEAAKKRRAAGASPTATASPQHAPASIEIDAPRIASPLASPTSSTSSTSPSPDMNSFDVELSFMMQNQGMGASPAWQPPLQTGVASGQQVIDQMMWSLRKLDNTHLTGGTDDHFVDHQVPSLPPRDLLSDLESASDAESSMMELFDNVGPSV